MFRKYHFRSRAFCVICGERNNYTAYQLTSTVLPLPIAVTALCRGSAAARLLGMRVRIPPEALIPVPS